MGAAPSGVAPCAAQKLPAARNPWTLLCIATLSRAMCVPATKVHRLAGIRLRRGFYRGHLEIRRGADRLSRVLRNWAASAIQISEAKDLKTSVTF
jgi:hypothetical protein